MHHLQNHTILAITPTPQKILPGGSGFHVVVAAHVTGAQGQLPLAAMVRAGSGAEASPYPAESAEDL